MRGYVTTRHLLIHAPIIIQEFGWRAYFRCLIRCTLATEPVTFLGCVCAAESRPRPKPRGLHAWS